MMHLMTDFVSEDRIEERSGDLAVVHSHAITHQRDERTTIIEDAAAGGIMWRHRSDGLVDADIGAPKFIDAVDNGGDLSGGARDAFAAGDEGSGGRGASRSLCAGAVPEAGIVISARPPALPLASHRRRRTPPMTGSGVVLRADCVRAGHPRPRPANAHSARPRLRGQGPLARDYQPQVHTDYRIAGVRECQANSFWREASADSAHRGELMARDRRLFADMEAAREL